MQTQTTPEPTSAKPDDQPADRPAVTKRAPPISSDELRLSLYQAQIEQLAKDPSDDPDHEHFAAEAFKVGSLDHQNALKLQRVATKNLPDLSELSVLDSHYYVVDDLLREISQSTKQLPKYGWALVSSLSNPMGLPVVAIRTAAEQLRARKKLGLQPPSTLASYVLSRLGLCGFSARGSELIGTAASFLFAFYFLEHLKLTKRFNPLAQITGLDYEFTPADSMLSVQATREVELPVKRKIYQLAYFCAEVSKTRIDRLTLKVLESECAVQLDKQEEQINLLERLRFGL